MIKNIIFDLDNTIIENKEEYISHYKEALESFGYDKNDYHLIYQLIAEYEVSLNADNRFYNKQDLIDFINKKLNKNYDISLIDKLAEVMGKYWTKYIFLENSTLEYLNQKYTLYVFTNWFKDSQTERLKNIDYLKYFSGVFGSDTVGAKPFKASFDNVLNKIGASPEECVMVGDNKALDILGATNAGINGILFDYDGLRDNPEIKVNKYTTISNLKILEDIL